MTRAAVAETTALGAAYAAGLAVGFWSDLDSLRAQCHAGTRWQPAMSARHRDQLFARWNAAVSRSLGWAASEQAGEVDVADASTSGAAISSSSSSAAVAK